MQTKITNLAKGFEKLKIIQELMKVTGNSMLAMQVKIGVSDPVFHDEIIENMRQQLVDNPEATGMVIGIKAATLINNY